jgi:NADPH:quinone reductase-like Zn-dependent oxidoreductase
MGRNGGMGGVMVRAVVLSNFDGLGGVDVREVDEPVVTDDGVLIRVVYAALGPWDVATTHGAFVGAGGGNGLPQVLGWDFAGIVESVGSQVSGFTPGERVLGFSPQPWSGIGALAELIAVPAGMIAPVPTGLDLSAARARSSIVTATWPGRSRSWSGRAWTSPSTWSDPGCGQRNWPRHATVAGS